MGSCVLVHKSTEQAIQFSLQVQSPTKDSVHGSAEPGFSRVDDLLSSVEQKEDSSPESSKPDMFFDSQPWLESDCEDFFSVNDDFTPSPGNTPIHPKSFIRNSLHDDETLLMAKPSPSDTKRQLFELFCESFRHDTTKGDQNLEKELEEEQKHIQIYGIKTPYESLPNSVCSSEPTPNRGGYLSKKQKSSQSVQCCFPSFVRSLSFRERKKRPSPAKFSRW